jgi:hypothetical protein
MSKSALKDKVIIIIIGVFVAMLHGVTGPGYSGPFPAFVNGYLIDILLPFTMYLVLTVSKQTILRVTIFKAGFVFTIGCIVETCQYFGIPIFGKTFDYLDYFMYGLGICLGIVFEKLVIHCGSDAIKDNIDE